MDQMNGTVVQVSLIINMIKTWIRMKCIKKHVEDYIYQYKRRNIRSLLSQYHVWNFLNNNHSPSDIFNIMKTG